MSTLRDALLAAALVAISCAGPQNLSEFAIDVPPEEVRAFPWVVLSTDPAGDGKRSSSADGKSFAYHHEAGGDTLWFRFELYGGIDPAAPAVSVAVDTDGDQRTGMSWYGSNEAFTFDKMLSVGPVERSGDVYRGYNGVTNIEGVRQLEWINERQGVLTLYADSSSTTYYLAVSPDDIDTGLVRFHVIGSVGSDARWNDDIGETGYGTIDLGRH